MEDETRQAVIRSELQRNLIVASAEAARLKMASDAAEERMANAAADASTAPTEIADYCQRLRLYELLKFYIKDRIDLPFAKEHVRQSSVLVNRDFVATTEEMALQRLMVEDRAAEAEIKLNTIQGGIQFFHRNLPWWHEREQITKLRLERKEQRTEPQPQSSEPASEPSKENERPITDGSEPTYGEWNERVIEAKFPKKPLRRALANAIVIKQTRRWKELYIWLDDNNYDAEELLSKDWKMPKGERPSFETAYKFNKDLMDGYALKVWNLMLPRIN